MLKRSLPHETCRFCHVQKTHVLPQLPQTHSQRLTHMLICARCSSKWGPTKCLQQWQRFRSLFSVMFLRSSHVSPSLFPTTQHPSNIVYTHPTQPEKQLIKLCDLYPLMHARQLGSQATQSPDVSELFTATTAQIPVDVSHEILLKLSCADRYTTITCVSGWWNSLLDASRYRVDSRLVTLDEQGMILVC